MVFNDRLKQLRLECNFLQKEIAAKLGVSIRTFQGWETGRSEPSIAKLIDIADFFGVSIDWLVGRDVIRSALVRTDERPARSPACPID